MLKIPENKEEEKGLYDLWRIILKRLNVIFLVTLIFAALGLGLSFSRPKIWEGSMVMRIGQVGEENTIEPMATILARTQHPTFLTTTINQLQLQQDEKIKTFNLLTESLRVTEIDYTNVIEIKLRSYDRERTRLLLQTIAQQIELHNEKIPEIIKQTKLKNKIAISKIEIISKHYANLINLISAKCTNASELAKSIENLNADKRNLLKFDAKIEHMELIIAQTYPTKIIESIYVSKEPTSPSKTRFTLLMAFLGLISSIIFMIVYNELKNERKN